MIGRLARPAALRPRRLTLALCLLGALLLHLLLHLLGALLLGATGSMVW